jgi:hypothetical protein
VDFSKPFDAAKKIPSIINDLRNYEEMSIFAKKSYHDIFNAIDNAQTMVDVILNELKDDYNAH